MAILAEDKVIFNTSVVIWQILYILFQLGPLWEGGGKIRSKMGWLIAFTAWICQYSGGSNSECSKSEPIRNPNLFVFRFRMVDYSKTNHSKTKLQNGHFSLGHFTLYSINLLCIKRPSLERAILKSLVFE